MKTKVNIRLDYGRKVGIMKGINTQPVMEFIENFRPNWKNLVLPIVTQESHFMFSVVNQKD
jgi:hypothetical protein